MKKYLIFDLWYTLIYLDDGWKTFNLLKEDFDIPRDVWVRDVKQLFLCNKYADEKSFLKEFVNVTKKDIDIDKYAKIMNMQKRYDLDNIKIYPETIPTLARIKDQGCNIGIISNQCSFYEQWFHISPLVKYIDTAVFSNDVGIRKPDSKIYHMFMDKVDIKPNECMMIGDSIDQDVIMPKSLGMSAIHLYRKGDNSDSISTLDELFHKL
jgi:putative hydrolase of the HAD superfamily